MSIATLLVLGAGLAGGSDPVRPAVHPGHAGPAAAWDGRRFVVHEWGTLTTVLGSDGVVLEGLVHDDRDLPEFVHDLADHAGLSGVSPKMETPVVYVYAPEPLRLEVDVRFPRGLVTHWYPAASSVNHGWLVDFAGAERPEISTLRDGHVVWGGRFELRALARGTAFEPLPVAQDDPWRLAREVDANVLRVCNARQAAPPRTAVLHDERFLFYRGLGDFPLPLGARVLEERVRRDPDGRERLTVRLVLENAVPAEPLRDLFLIVVDDGRIGWRALGDLATPLDLGAVELELASRADGRALERLGDRIAAALVAAGLYADEARAMARSWQHAWFGDEGLRICAVLPRELVDRELPLSMRTQPEWAPSDGGGRAARLPDEVERVFVGRFELLSPQRERAIAATVERLASPSDFARACAEEELRSWGRLAAPYLARYLALHADAAGDDAQRHARERLERVRRTSVLGLGGANVQEAGPGEPDRPPSEL